MYYSNPHLYELPFRYDYDGYIYNQPLETSAIPAMGPSYEDERFFPFIPFVAGLAIGPLLLAPFLLNKPCCPPYGPSPYGPTPYPYPPMYPNAAIPPYQMSPLASNYHPSYGGITENINIYTK